MVDLTLHIITFAFYLILIGISLGYLIKKMVDKDNQNVASESDQPRHYMKLSSLRSNYFSEDVKYHTYFIKEYLLESFNIYLSLNPDIITTLSKAEKALMVFDTQLDEMSLTANDIILRFDRLELALDEMIWIFDQIVDRMNTLIEETTDKDTESQLDPEMVKVYVEIVNSVQALLDTHSVTNLSLHRKISNQFPDLMPRYRKISKKIIYLYFMEIQSFADRLDEEITVYL